MNKLLLLLSIGTSLYLSSCTSNDLHDASGTFEAEEIILSAEQTGKILSLTVAEGDAVTKNQSLGQIDVSNDKLKADQVEASIQALQKKTNNPEEQIKLMQKQVQVQQAQLAQLKREKNRITNLLKADAATQKQLDDINAQIDQIEKQELVTEQQLNVTVANIRTQNNSILSEKDPLEKSIAQIKNQIGKGEIISPITGTVLMKYAYAGEITTTGKAILKLANLDTLNLKAYITGDQLAKIKLGQTVKVFIDQDKKSFKEYAGKISFISSKAEFTPKTILTKNERANQVYAIKVRVPNDGFLKIGMYGEVAF